MQEELLRLRNRLDSEGLVEHTARKFRNRGIRRVGSIHTHTRVWLCVYVSMAWYMHACVCAVCKCVEFLVQSDMYGQKCYMYMGVTYGM